MIADLAGCAEVSLGPIRQIPVGEGREFKVAGRQVAIFHGRSGVVYATQALCPHRQGPLVDGLLGGDVLVCPLHSWRFNLSTGEPMAGECGLTTYPVRLDVDGNIMLQLENGAA